MYFIIDAVSSVLRMCGKTKGNVEMKKRRCNLVRNRIYKAERMVYGDDMDVSINSDRIVYARFFLLRNMKKILLTASITTYMLRPKIFR